MPDPTDAEVVAVAAARWNARYPEHPWNAGDYIGKPDVRAETRAALRALHAHHAAQGNVLLPVPAALADAVRDVIAGKAVVVPREPTHAMLMAADAEPPPRVITCFYPTFAAEYRAALAASPYATKPENPDDR